ncbi:syntaxin-5-like [Uloborus diversus]|uniref:syntaxin-5-like n=1 Tax=Uloborus diversus TaxID=327109 RepID=UPI002409BDA0|nr:syntaxin-5-like [Uloborus diversus]XP_054710144.1 syntaxin-5-like [Uloborus diversus]
MTTLRRRTNSERNADFSSVLLDQRQHPTYEVLTSPGADTVLKMTCRNRTAEFMSVVKLKESKRDRLKENGFMTKGKNDREKGIGDFHNFMQIAKEIGKDISSTFMKVEKLTLLAKKRSLFEDKPADIEELTYIIKQDIASLNKQIAQLEEMSKARNQNHGKHMRSHSKSVVLSLQTKLAKMYTDFKDVLEIRTSNLKHEKSRREHFTQSVALPAAAGGMNSVFIPHGDGESSSEVTINMDVSRIHNRQEQMQLIDEQDAYIQSRADAMQNIEETIVELGTIFSNLAHMVKEQEEVLQRIDYNVEDAQLNVEAAHSEILKYFQSVSSNRSLMIKIFAVLIVFFVIFVVFLA